MYKGCEHGAEFWNTFALSKLESLTGRLSVFTGLHQSKPCQALVVRRVPISAMIE
jgi:hypothetical protein